MKKGKWSKEEDDLIKNHIEKYGIRRSWQGLSNTLGLQRCGRSCRSRWLNYLRPGLKHGNFTPAEDRIICEMYSKRGSCWSVIAAKLPGRTDLAIKNYWNCTLKKRFPRAARSRRGHRRASSTWSDAASPYRPLVIYNEQESISTATPDLALVVYNEQESISTATPDLALVAYNEQESISTVTPYLALVVYNEVSATTGSLSGHTSVDNMPVSASTPTVQVWLQPQPMAADAWTNDEPIAAVPVSGPVRVRIEPLSPPPLGDEIIEMDIGCVSMSPLPLGLMEPYLLDILPPPADFDDIDSFLSFFDD